MTHFSDIDAVLLGAEVQRCETVAGRGVHVRLVLNHHRHHVTVSLLRGEVQRREAGFALGICGSLVREQCSSDLHLVLLRSNVLWRIAILGRSVWTGAVLE